MEPEELAAIALSKTAMEDPRDDALLAELAQMSGLLIQPFVSSKRQLKLAIAESYD